MRIKIESTNKIVTLNGIHARIWEGETETGIKCHCFITRIAAHKDDDLGQFDRELQEHQEPSPEIQAYPMRLVL